MGNNSKQNEESFFSLMFQFSIMMLVFWLILTLIRPLFPEQKENEPIAANGKRNFQYACYFKTIDEDIEENSESETINLEELTDVSYDVESYINNLYVSMVEKVSRKLQIKVEKKYIDVKKYSLSNGNDVIILQDEEKSLLIISNSVEDIGDISEEYQHEIMLKLAEIYQIQYEKQNYTPTDTYVEEKQFGKGMRTLVYENMVNITLDQNENLIIYFFKKTVPHIERCVLEGTYTQVENAFVENITNMANTHILYTPLEAFEYHLSRYYEYEKAQKNLRVA